MNLGSALGLGVSLIGIGSGIEAPLLVFIGGAVILFYLIEAVAFVLMGEGNQDEDVHGR